MHGRPEWLKEDLAGGAKTVNWIAQLASVRVAFCIHSPVSRFRPDGLTPLMLALKIRGTSSQDQICTRRSVMMFMLAFGTVAFSR